MLVFVVWMVDWWVGSVPLVLTMHRPAAVSVCRVNRDLLQSMDQPFAGNSNTNSFFFALLRFASRSLTLCCVTVTVTTGHVLPVTSLQRPPLRCAHHAPLEPTTLHSMLPHVCRALNVPALRLRLTSTLQSWG